MHRLAVLAVAACVLLSACSTRMLRDHDELWEGAATPDGAAFLGYHGRLAQPVREPGT